MAARWLSTIHRPGAVVVLEAVSVVVVATLVTGLALRLDAAGTVRVERALTVFGFGAAIAAAILLGLGAWLTSDGRVARVTAAVGVSSTLFVSSTLVDLDSAARSVTSHACLAVAVAVLLTSLYPATGPGRTALAVLGGAAVVTLAAVPALDLGATTLGASATTVAGVAVGAATGAVALALAVRGVRGDQPLLRRVGTGFLVIALARLTGAVGSAQGTVPVPAVVLELTGVAIVLLAAIAFAAGAVRGLWHQHEDWQARLATAEAAAEESARRDHEVLNLVVGLSGAAGALGPRIESATGRHLHAVASAELERLRMLLGDPAAVAPAPVAAPVVDVLHDIAAVHRAGGAHVRVRARGPLQAAIDARALTQVLTNLLLNCARHAPGAPVELRAVPAGARVRIEVVDAGPGLPPGVEPAALLGSGVRSVTSPGQGLGLGISADIVRRHGGRLWIGRAVPGPGCVVVVEVPGVPVPAVQRIG